MRRVLAWALLVLTLTLAAADVLINRSVTDAAIGLALIVSWGAVGGLLALRRPDNLEAWLVLLVGLLWAVVLFPLDQVLANAGWSTVRIAEVFWPTTASWTLPVGLMGTQVLLRFPNGSLPSPRWRWFSWASLAVIVALSIGFPFAQDTLEVGGGAKLDNPGYRYAAQAPTIVLLALFMACIVASVTSIVVRRRRAGPIEREQIRWILWAAATFAGLYIVAVVGSIALEAVGADRAGAVVQQLIFLGFVLVPVAIGFAVLRYRLYDIDRIISRTALYALVSGSVVAVYVVVVALVPRVLHVSSSLVVASATLSAAAVFRPLLGRARALVDRRFDRARYDALRTVEGFARRSRDEVDPDAVQADLLAVVQATLQPATATIWLRGAPK